uniref:Uncharacterized protein n=1 Tax=Arundo donax TaxID=35708 RepID=A0A0A9EWR1_ARUDO
MFYSYYHIHHLDQRTCKEPYNVNHKKHQAHRDSLYWTETLLDHEQDMRLEMAEVQKDSIRLEHHKQVKV